VCCMYEREREFVWYFAVPERFCLCGTPSQNPYSLNQTPLLISCCSRIVAAPLDVLKEMVTAF